MAKVAVLIADSDAPFFKSIKSEVSKIGWDALTKRDVDVYYIKGKQKSYCQEKVFNVLESMRYTKFWPIQYILDNIILFKYRFITPKTYINGKEIYVEIPESLNYLAIKILSGLIKLRDMEYEFVFRTTLSTLVNKSLFEETFSGLSSEEITYAGYLIDFNSNKFISGSASIFNKAAIEHLSANKWRMNFARLDDVAFGRLLTKVTNPIPLPHINLASLEDVHNQTNEQLSEYLSFRCKSDSIPRQDVEIALELLKRVEHNV